MSEPSSVNQSRPSTGRYSVVNVAWRRQGPRKGLLRRRQETLRSKVFGEADSLLMASQILAAAPLYSDEAVYVYDRANYGLTVGAKYGWAWHR